MPPTNSSRSSSSSSSSSSNSSSSTKPPSKFAGYLDAVRKQIPSDPFYKIGPIVLLMVILIGTLLVPMLATCSVDWYGPLFTLGLEKRIKVLG